MVCSRDTDSAWGPSRFGVHSGGRLLGSCTSVSSLYLYTTRTQCTSSAHNTYMGWIIASRNCIFVSEKTFLAEHSSCVLTSTQSNVQCLVISTIASVLPAQWNMFVRCLVISTIASVLPSQWNRVLKKS